MKKKFTTRLEVIDWITANAKNEGEFEVMREQMNYNFIYSGEYFLEVEKEMGVVVMIAANRPNGDGKCFRSEGNLVYESTY